jgi:hypothetical protein
MEYVTRDQTGKRIKHGTFKADPNGQFTLSLDIPTPATVEVRVVGGAGYAGDCCRVDVVTDNDLINLPRRLNPLGALGDDRRVASL